MSSRDLHSNGASMMRVMRWVAWCAWLALGLTLGGVRIARAQDVPPPDVQTVQVPPPDVQTVQVPPPSTQVPVVQVPAGDATGRPPPPSPRAALLPQAPMSSWAWRFQGQLGGFFSKPADGLFVGLAWHLRARWIAVGAGASLSTMVFNEHNWTLHSDAGLSLPVGHNVTLDVLGTLGAHYYTARGGEVNLLGTDDPGTSGTLGFFGGRVGLHYVRDVAATPNPIRPTFGVVGSIERDFHQVTKQYSYIEEGGLFGGGPTLVQESAQLGGTRVTLVFTGGVTVDL